MENKYWIDDKTGLYWELKSYGNRRMEYTIEEAYEYAKELNDEKFGGFEDWRVPTLDELKTICSIEPYEYKGDYVSWRAWFEGVRDFSSNGFFIVSELSQNVGKDGWYWSATQKNEKENYLLNYKEANTNYHLKTQSFYVRCVRG